MADILIVDDSIVTAKMEARYLADDGHICRISASGAEAMAMYGEQQPDLVLLDYMLPDINGLEVLRDLLRRNPDQIVVMVTGQGHEELAAEVIKAGARDYVVKSNRFLEPLVQVVNRVLSDDAIRRELEEKSRLNERLQAQNEISFWVAHNFRNIFSGAIGFLELIDFERAEQTSENRSRYLFQALKSLRRASELVDQLLSLTDSGLHEPEPARLSELVAHALQNVKKNVRGIDNQCQPFVFEDQTSHLPELMLPSRDLRLVLENLIQNAVESFDAPGLVTVSAEQADDGSIRLTIRDNGRGMDREARRKAMEPMFSTKGTVGVGMGLSLALAAIRRHNGDIQIQSDPNRGTTVTVTLEQV